MSKRKDLDISTVAVAFLINVSSDGTKKSIDEIRIALAGVAKTIVRLGDVEAKLQGKPFDLKTFVDGGKLARAAVKPISDVRGSDEYRLQLVENIFSKLYYELVGGAACLT